MIKKEKPEEYQNRLRKVIDVEILNSSLFIIRLERGQKKFISGQFVILGLPGSTVKREYSIYSSMNEEYIEVLIREVPDGDLSATLKKLKAGDQLVVDGPAGDFILPEDKQNKKFLFVSSGTGLSPFHSFIKSFPDLDYHLLIGIRNQKDLVLCRELDPSRYTICMSQDQGGDFKGYVTEYLRKHPKTDYDQAFICGNGNMAYDTYRLLNEQGYSAEKLKTEIFF